MKLALKEDRLTLYLIPLYFFLHTHTIVYIIMNANILLDPSIGNTAKITHTTIAIPGILTFFYLFYNFCKYVRMMQRKEKGRVKEWKKMKRVMLAFLAYLLLWFIVLVMYVTTTIPQSINYGF